MVNNSEERTSMKRKLLLLTAAVGALAAVGGFSVATSSASSAKASADSLSGAGSTFVTPLISKWQQDYPAKTGVEVSYNPIGSGGGIAAITARTVDFGASDAPLSPDQFSACNGCVQVPWALSATSIPYNLNGVGSHLKMTGPLLASIYLGNIKTWDDPAIKKLNPKAKLPSTAITPVYRSDGSGTTYNFTDYLSAVSPQWKRQVGNSTQVNFPAGIGARGSSGVTGVVSRTEGALTYVDVAFSLKNKLQFMSMKNSFGSFVLPGLRQINNAVKNIKTEKIPANNEMHIVNPPKSEKFAYPICTFTYVILPTKTDKAPMLRRFVNYAINPTQGQKFGPPLIFAPLPVNVQIAGEKTLKKVQS
jgi:phosphate transport system substrate-binding protein